MLATMVFAILAALATAVRFYVDRRVGQLSSRALIERDKAVKAELDRAVLAQQTTADELASVKKLSQGRSLTAEQQGALTASAKSVAAIIAEVEVTAATGNHEAQFYAMDFVTSLRGAGIVADLALPTPGLRPEILGVAIAVRDASNPPPGAAALAQALSLTGIPFRIGPMEPSFFPTRSFVLAIGAKEQP